MAYIRSIVGVRVESVHLKTSHRLHSLRVEVSVGGEHQSTWAAGDLPNHVIAVVLCSITVIITATTAGAIIVLSIVIAAADYGVHEAVDKHVIDYGRGLLVVIVRTPLIGSTSLTGGVAEGGTRRICKVINVVIHHRASFEEGCASLARVKCGVVDARGISSIKTINFEDKFSVGYPVEGAPFRVKIDNLVVARNVVK